MKYFKPPYIKSYIILITSIVTIILISQLIIQFMINRHSIELKSINISGQQRMLTQQMSKNYILIEDEDDFNSINLLLEKNQSLLNKIKNNYSYLSERHKENNLHNIINRWVDYINNKTKTKQLEKKIKPLINDCENDINAIQTSLKYNRKHNDIKRSIQTLDNLLILSSLYVNSIQHDAQNELKFFQLIEILLSVLIITTLVIELLYIFRPLIIDLKSQNLELVKLNETKNKFIGMVVHDLRNPLTVIKNYSDFIAESQNEIKENDDHISIIQASATYMLDLVHELLDVSVIESDSFTIKKEPTNLEESIQSSIRLNQIFADKKQIELVFNHNEKVTSLLDSSKIIQVITNLISNAIKYSHKNTKIEVELLRNNDKIDIKVKDQGQGIKENELENLFEPFVVTSTKGTDGEKSIGLGLTIVKKIIEAHNGDISVESKYGVGTTFSISLPIEQQIESQKTEESEIPLFPLKFTSEIPRILVCEDNDLLQLFMKKIFKSFNLKAQFCSNGAEGLKVLKSNPEIDIIFTDLQMPIMGGIEFSKIVKESYPKIKIIALSGNSTKEIIKEVYNTGIDLFVEKPLSSNDLRDILIEN